MVVNVKLDTMPSISATERFVYILHLTGNARYVILRHPVIGEVICNTAPRVGMLEVSMMYWKPSRQSAYV